MIQNENHFSQCILLPCNSMLQYSLDVDLISWRVLWPTLTAAMAKIWKFQWDLIVGSPVHNSFLSHSSKFFPLSGRKKYILVANILPGRKARQFLDLAIHVIDSRNLSRLHYIQMVNMYLPIFLKIQITCLQMPNDSSELPGFLLG